jgi:redox-sensitive bicupin YhaK (pirin superfamily)
MTNAILPKGLLGILPAQSASDGAGVKINRSIGTWDLDHVDPFLLLDEFRSDNPDDYIAGFPMHPHRGIETVTYMLAGQVKHEDSLGNEGVIGPGDVQWMTAASGIVHSEMPEQRGGLLWGFQLWVNLPKSDKMAHPRYQNIASNEIPVISRPDGTIIKVISGKVDNVRGPIQGVSVDPIYLDVDLPENSSFEYLVPDNNATLAYVFEGQGLFGSSREKVGLKNFSELVAFADGNAVQVETKSTSVRFLLLSAKPLHEQIARRGPFVMNTHDEIEKAFADYRNGTFLETTDTENNLSH